MSRLASFEILRGLNFYCLYYSILANSCHCSGAGIISFLVEMSDHTVFYLHRLRLDLKISPNSSRLGRQQISGVCVCVCVCVCVRVESVECGEFVFLF